MNRTVVCYCILEEIKVQAKLKKRLLVELLQGEYLLSSAVEPKNLLIIENMKRSWIEHILCTMPCTKWIIYSISFTVQ